MRRKAGFAVLMALGSTVAAIALVELGVRLVSSHGPSLFDVEMWRYARQVKIESQWPGIVEEHRRNVEAQLTKVRIRTDELGFRRPDPDSEKLRASNDRCVVVIGDSLTLGWGVAEGRAYPDLLEKKLNEASRRPGGRGVTVFNAGIGNSNTSMQLARYKRDVRPLRPEWLVLGFFINDAERDPVPSRSLLIRHSALAALISGQLQVRVRGRYREYLTYYRQLYEDDHSGWQRLQQALKEFGQILREDNTAATLVLLPEMHEPKDFGPFANIYRPVGSVGAANGFEIIDASRGFPGGPGNRYWVSPNDGHPNAAAHEIFAAALAKSRHALTMIQNGG